MDSDIHDNDEEVNNAVIDISRDSLIEAQKAIEDEFGEYETIKKTKR